ncbi:MAG: hypothetical protein A2945_01255 [Candidatus Liptonbacteria bacterium RIFCSPLOWO2_01_FULL_52_25]|uniref:Cell shape-determining protein MreC n=1 Tax=Candidatus Liptonbacteria bacterium RIFCSPLOWO2_01_FULL_52_25 TaxID=1798650 RepID=A0A1G2CGC7_9BACT|nr:MAG: hypothetical protein A2945_01255 [Candidatus Liptonbacteria bacterium RIFCSPLOWO2_01_FULL_52_25]
MAKTYAIPLVLAIMLGLFIIFAPQFAWQMRTRFMPPLADTGENLLLENQNLKAELAKFKNIQAAFPDGTRGSIPAVVYSRYPFNFKHEFLISAGRVQGVAPNAAVTFSGVLIGKAAKVFDDTTLVRTVFDSGFQAPVRIGNAGIEALFKGGNLPKITLIPEKSEVRKGDVIYSSSPDFPYGIPVGEINKITASADQLFQEATVTFAYDVGAIQAVMVTKQ